MAGPSPQLFTHPAQSLTCLALLAVRRTLTTSYNHASSANGHFRRSDFHGQGFTGIYDAGGPTLGPLGDASTYGAPRITPKVLKDHLDQFVVGQERAKKVLSTAVYNHYQRVQELQRRDDEEEELLAQQARQSMRHPVEDEFPGQQPTVNVYASTSDQTPFAGRSKDVSPTSPILDLSPLTIEKSNVLLLGPSGVGKTLMAKTLARVLEVPFSMSDCTPFTQAGYIGEDVEVCVQRLLAAANFDVTRAERGIICLDEIDKIATARVSHGKDVSGEGVQQALLKIIEGTTVQVQAKQERGSPSVAGGTRSHNHIPTAGTPLGGGGQNYMQPNKGDIYNVNTDNILFICTGAFIGLHKFVRDRIAKGSIGFGADVRLAQNVSSSDANDPTIRPGNKADDELFRKHLPFFSSVPSAGSSAVKDTQHSLDMEVEETLYNTLDLTTPTDLQKFGLIPELVGRLPITCALSPLSLTSLIRVLTEPRNSLLSQYMQLFSLSGMELRFTTPALYEVARSAQGMGTGARGLRTVMERLLGEAMFETPGSGVKYVLVNERAAKRLEAVSYFARGMHGRFLGCIADEEEEWERKKRRRKGEKDKVPPGGGNGAGADDSITTFEQYRERGNLAGAG